MNKIYVPNNVLALHTGLLIGAVDSVEQGATP